MVDPRIRRYRFCFLTSQLRTIHRLLSIGGISIPSSAQVARAIMTAEAMVAALVIMAPIMDASRPSYITAFIL